MLLDAEACYRALRSHDRRFDGRIFVGVSSTGIYCRPVCTVRPPKRENCAFFPSAAAAERAGYRPCLRCRPELAPGFSSVDAAGRLAGAAASLIDDGVLADADLAVLAQRLNVSARHLRRVFAAHYGVSPVEYAQTRRLLLAKCFLTDTHMPITDVAMAAGFGSVRRFNALFQQRYGLKPMQLRTRADAGEAPFFAFDLAYRPPYAWSEQLEFLAGRAIAGVEEVADGRYRRAVAMPAGGAWRRGWIEVAHAPERCSLRVRVSAGLAGAVAPVLVRVKRLFDLGCRPDEVAGVLGPLAVTAPGLRVPGAFDGFEMAVRGILGQQITVKAARTLAGRVAQRFGVPVETDWPGIICAFPPAQAMADANAEELGLLGINRRRVEAIRALARAVSDAALVLEPGGDVGRQVEHLRSLPAIGEWTAQYIAMRALGWPDAFPHTDYGVMKALGERSPRRVLEIAEAWRPWRAYATLHLWRSLVATKA